MEDFFLNRFSARLNEVPAAGEPVFLSEIGNHNHGAVFLDLSWAVTPELENAIDRLAHRMEGFFLGRFDVRVPTLAALRKGEEFRVLELNGVSAEQSHIYDPNKISIWKAWRVMMNQWHLAYEIGSENVRRGCKKDSLFSVFEKLIHRGRRSDVKNPVILPGKTKTTPPRTESSPATKEY